MRGSCKNEIRAAEDQPDWQPRDQVPAQRGRQEDHRQHHPISGRPRHQGAVSQSIR